MQHRLILLGYTERPSMYARMLQGGFYWVYVRRIDFKLERQLRVRWSANIRPQLISRQSVAVAAMTTLEDYTLGNRDEV